MAPKGKLNEDVLRENGITYSLRLATFPMLSRTHAEAANLQQGLLDFEKILSESSFNQLTKTTQEVIKTEFSESRIPPLAEHAKLSCKKVDRYNDRYQVALQDAKFAQAQEIAQAARDIVAAKEPRWASLIKDVLFGKLIRDARVAEGEGQGHFTAAKVLETIRVEDEDLWSQGRKALERTTPSSAPLLSAPKADLYVALPILSKSSKPRGFYNDDCIQNFHETRLAQLCEKGLISCPIADLSGLKRLDLKHLLCFPSSVIEVKHHKVKPSEEKKCYYQAANASSSALAMLSTLSAHAYESISPQIVRPVVSFTFIGPEAKVWITYTKSRKWVTYINSKKKRYQRLRCEYEMRCIWQGNLREVWDSMQLCCIIEHLRYWTLRHFRPWISSCLDQWYLKHNITGLRESRDTDVDEDEDEAEDEDEDDLLSRDEDDLSSTNDESEEEDSNESEKEGDEVNEEEGADEMEEEEDSESEQEKNDAIDKETIKQKETRKQKEKQKQKEEGKQKKKGMQKEEGKQKEEREQKGEGKEEKQKEEGKQKEEKKQENGKRDKAKQKEEEKQKEEKNQKEEKSQRGEEKQKEKKKQEVNNASPRRASGDLEKGEAGEFFFNHSSDKGKDQKSYFGSATPAQHQSIFGNLIDAYRTAPTLISSTAEELQSHNTWSHSEPPNNTKLEPVEPNSSNKKTPPMTPSSSGAPKVVLSPSSSSLKLASAAVFSFRNKSDGSGSKDKDAADNTSSPNFFNFLRNDDPRSGSSPSFSSSSNSSSSSSS